MSKQKRSDSLAENRRFSRHLLQLNSLQTSYQETAVREKEQHLQSLRNLKTSKAPALFDYYKVLLFNSCYPPNRLIQQLCNTELFLFHNRVAALPRKEFRSLEQSGLPGSSMHGVYSYTLINWLNQEKLIESELLSFDEDAQHPVQLLRDNFLEAEFELLHHEAKSHLDWLKDTFGNQKNNLLTELLKQIALTEGSEAQKDHLFESLRPIIQFVCGEFELKLSFEKQGFIHHDGLNKKVDSGIIMNSPLPNCVRLNKRQKLELIQKARLCLLYLNRETDPVTNSYPEGLEYYRLERGFSLAFFSQKPERRLAFESYIGFMMFKNGIPISYGGAWIFGRKSLLGINIFEAFRGGESAYLFSQLLRAYRQRFKPSSIEVEAYQFGLDNPEGIKTGAFWFYYRFGFRPADPRLRVIAAREFNKITTSKTYKCPIRTLKSFTASNMVLNFEDQEILPDTSALSNYISKSIHMFFAGNRRDFRKKAQEKISDELGIQYKSLGRNEKVGYEKLLAFVALCLDLKNMTEPDRKLLCELVLEKGRSEFRFTELCALFPFDKYLKTGN